VGGRCETCEGNGFVAIDMQFLSDVTVVCESCDGKRFGPAVLSVRLRGRNISDVLALTIEEALSVFGDVKALVGKLSPLESAGLAYLTLGQPTSTPLGRGGAAAEDRFVSGRSETETGAGTRSSCSTSPRRVLPEDVEFFFASSGGSLERALDPHGGAPPRLSSKADHVIELGPSGGPRRARRLRRDPCRFDDPAHISDGPGASLATIS
jgi:excinuclease ABC subunit A